MPALARPVPERPASLHRLAARTAVRSVGIKRRRRGRPGRGGIGLGAHAHPMLAFFASRHIDDSNRPRAVMDTTEPIEGLDSLRPSIPDSVKPAPARHTISIANSWEAASSQFFAARPTLGSYCSVNRVQ